jgi:hypothetical protein
MAKNVRWRTEERNFLTENDGCLSASPSRRTLVDLPESADALGEELTKFVIRNLGAGKLERSTNAHYFADATNEGESAACE